MSSLMAGSVRGRWILTATVLASGGVFLLGGTVSIALPAIQSYFAGVFSGLQWVVNAQLLTLAALIPVGGALGDRFGRKRIFLIGLAVFAAMGVLSGLAQSLNQLIVLQAAQGIGSALVVPQSLAVINVSFEERGRGQVIGLWAGLSGAISAMGPWVGGWLVQSFSWRAIFFMPALVALAAILITAIFVPESKSQRRRVDWLGALLLFIGLLGIAYGLISGSSGWSNPVVIISLVFGVAGLLGFAFVESRILAPMVPPRMFKQPLVLGANLCTLLLYFSLNGVMLFTVLNLQQVQGYSPSAAGLALLPVIVAITLFSGPAGTLADRIGPRLQMVLGPAIVAVGAVLLMTGGTAASYAAHFFPGFLLVGLGMALVIAPLTKSALAVPQELSGAASGVNNAVARIAALLAVAVLGILILGAFTGRLSGLLPDSGLTAPQQTAILSQSDKLGGIQVPPEGFNGTAQEMARQVIDQSFVYGFRWVMGLCAALALGAAIISAFMIRNPRR